MMSRLRNIAMLPLCVFSTLGSLGCNNGPEMAPVHGMLTFEGDPIAEGAVLFYPQQPGPMAAGVLGPGGSFELSTKRPRDGAFVGDYTVVVTPPTGVEGLRKKILAGRRPMLEYDNIPQEVRNRTTSPLRAVVKSGENNIELDIAKELGR